MLARMLVVGTLISVLSLARLLASIQAASAVTVSGLSDFRVAQRVVVQGDLKFKGIVPDDVFS